MKLNEFVLWGFKLDLTESRNFTLFNRCVCAHFERHFVPIETDGIYRVVVKLGEADHRVDSTELSSSVLKVYEEFDFGSFGKLSVKSKKELLLDTLYQSLMRLCEKYNWPKVNFREAYEQVVNEDFVNIYCISEKICRNRKMIAELLCEHDIGSFDCFLRVKDQSGREIRRELLFSEEPDEYLFNERIGDIRWLSNDILVHQKKDKTELARFEFG